jgi:hypothetical protein
MAKKKNIEIGDDENGGRAWREGDLIKTFKLNRIDDTTTPLMDEWLSADLPQLDMIEQAIFDRALARAKKSISGWSEEDLKMKFIGKVLELGGFTDEGGIIGYYDKIISAAIEGIKLTVKADFMLAEGILDVFDTPYFHFQEFKPFKNPKGDSMAQLLQAMMIGQVKNANGNPIYGIEIVGNQWIFVIMEGKDYCISTPLNSIDRDDLLKIVGMLRKFMVILHERLKN